jgi:hypothetical protein
VKLKARETIQLKYIEKIFLQHILKEEKMITERSSKIQEVLGTNKLLIMWVNMLTKVIISSLAEKMRQIKY